MAEIALIHISGGRWEGNTYEIEIDPHTQSPPEFFLISDDGLVLLSPDSSREIGRLYSGSLDNFPTPSPTIESTSVNKENGH